MYHVIESLSNYFESEISMQVEKKWRLSLYVNFIINDLFDHLNLKSSSLEQTISARLLTFLSGPCTFGVEAMTQRRSNTYKQGLFK